MSIEADLDWQVDEDGDDCALGVVYEYAIDLDNELAVFKDGKVVAIRENGCLKCAEAMGDAIERITKYQIRDGHPVRINKYLTGAWICDGKEHDPRKS